MTEIKSFYQDLYDSDIGQGENDFQRSLTFLNYQMIYVFLAKDS